MWFDPLVGSISICQVGKVPKGLCPHIDIDNDLPCCYNFLVERSFQDHAGLISILFVLSNFVGTRCMLKIDFSSLEIQASFIL